MNEIIQAITVYAFPVIFAITLHDAAKAYVARYFGDATAYLQGRATLNPLKHIDPIGTLLIPIVLAIVTSGRFVFGYGKPLPIVQENLRNPRVHMIWVALSGPMANVLQALAWMIAVVVLTLTGSDEPYFFRVANAGLLVNLVMFAISMFPLPPLDGGRIVLGLLPPKMAASYAKVEPYGFFIVLALVATGLLNVWMVPIMSATQAVLAALVRLFL